MRSSSTSILVAALAAGCGGCAIVGTQRIGPATAGVPYMVPKALLPVEVVSNGAQVRVDVLEPVFVGDPLHGFVLRYHANAFSTDNVKLEVDPTTSLLKTVTLVGKDETGEVLKKLVGSSLRAESATAGGEAVLLQTLLDPDEKNGGDKLAAQIDTAVQAHLLRQRKACSVASPATAPAGCAELPGDDVPTAAKVSVVLADGGGPPTDNEPSAADCSVGICHRANLPYRVEIALFGQTRSTLVMLPNKAPLLALPLERHAFVEVKHTVTLRNGVVEKYDIEKPSAALAVVSWPLEAYDAVVSTTAKILQLKIDTSRNDLAHQEQQVAATEKRRELEQRLKDLEAPVQAEGYGLVGLGPSRRLLTVGIGLPKRSLPNTPPPATTPQKDPIGSGQVLKGSDGNPAGGAK